MSCAEGRGVGRWRDILLIGCVAGLGSCSMDALDSPDPVYSTELVISGEQGGVIDRSLAPGAYLVEVRERDIDVRATLDYSGIHRQLADQVPRHGLLATVVEVSAPTELRVAVRSDDHRRNVGRAIVSIARYPRRTTEPPGDRERGFAAFGAAAEQTALGTPPSWSLAAGLLAEAAGRFATAGDGVARAQAEYTRGNLEYLVRNEWARATGAANSAEEAYRRLGDGIGAQRAASLRAAIELEVANTLNAVEQHAEIGRLFDSADLALENAAVFFTEHGAPVDAAYAMNMRGIGALYAGKNEQAGEYFQRAEKMSGAIGDFAEQAKSLSNLAWVHNRLGAIAQAAGEYERLLPLIERDRQPGLYAAIVGNLGYCLESLGDFDRALTLFTISLQLNTELHRNAEEARLLSALGALYAAVGDPERALSTFETAIKMHHRAMDGVGEASALRAAATASATLDRHDVALTMLRKAIQLDSNPQSIAHGHTMIAAQLRALGDLRAAEAEISLALESPNAWVQAFALDERGRLKFAQRSSAAAIMDLTSADRRFAELGLDRYRIQTNSLLSRIHLERREIAAASAAADLAVSLETRARLKSANPNWRAQFLSASYAPHEARIAADLASGEPDAAWRGFLSAENVRGLSLNDDLSRASSRFPTASAQAENGLRVKLATLQKRLEASLQTGTSDADVLSLRAALEATRAQLDAKRVSLAVDRQKLPRSRSQVQASLPADTAVLAYFVGDSATQIWLLTRDDFRHATAPGRAVMRKRIGLLVRKLRAAGGAKSEAAAASRMLIGDLLDGISARRLMILADGPVNAVPFGVLPLPGGADGEILIDRFVVAAAPSLTLAIGAASATRPASSRVAVVSDPVYSSNDQRVTIRLDRSARFERGAVEQVRLPYSAMEAGAVLRTFGSRDTMNLAGFDATAPRVLALSALPLKVLHFATHAVARQDEPYLSAMMLTRYGADGVALQDSRLTADDIARSGLRADLVVLSGCATGDGRELRGEGVLGLTYVFLANGSRSVVASLWPIEDASAAVFMDAFYDAYRASSRAPDALRTAQLQTRGTIAASAWASFVVRTREFP